MISARFWTPAAPECNLGQSLTNIIHSRQGFFFSFVQLLFLSYAALWQRILPRSDLICSQQGFCSIGGCEAVLTQGWLRNIKELTLGTKQRFYFDTERPKFTPRHRTRWSATAAECKSGYVRSDSHLLRGFRGVTALKDRSQAGVCQNPPQY